MYPGSQEHLIDDHGVAGGGEESNHFIIIYLSLYLPIYLSIYPGSQEHLIDDHGVAGGGEESNHLRNCGLNLIIYLSIYISIYLSR